MARDIRNYFAARRPMTAARSSSPDAGDPLLGNTNLLRLPELRPGPSLGRVAASTEAMAPGQSRIAVVLNASPQKRSALADAFAESTRTSHHGGVPRLRGINETPVPLPHIPGWAATLAKRTPANPAPAPEPAKSRGRPRGWKPGMSYSIMRGNVPRPRPARAKAPPNGFAKRRGRPSKAPSPPPRDIYRGLEPQFVAFLCEWAGCKAELHNLDTLRRHVYVVHGRVGGTSCRWRKCAHAQPAPSFADGAEFRQHVEEAHLVPLAWHVGDGPRNEDRHGLGAGDHDEIPDFLLDAQGRQVTPWVRDQELEDRATWRMNRRKLKALLLRREENLPDNDSESEGADESR